MSRAPWLLAGRTRRTELRRAVLATVAALPLLLATPGALLAKWSVVAEFEPTTATVGDPVELVAVIDIVGHLEMPSLADVEEVRFRLRSPVDGRAIAVPAVEAGPPAGRYTASVTLPDAGDWPVEIVFTLDGEEMTHASFPHQQPYVLTVLPSPTPPDVVPDTAIAGHAQHVPWLSLIAGWIVWTLAVVLWVARAAEAAQRRRRRPSTGDPWREQD